MSPPVASRLTVLLRTTDHAGHHALSTELLARARRANLAGATLLEGPVEAARARHGHLLSEDRPLCLVVVDDHEAVEAYLDQVRPLLGDALVALDDVRLLEA